MPTRKRKPKEVATSSATKSASKKTKAASGRVRKPKVSFDDPAPGAAAAPVDWVYRTGEASSAATAATSPAAPTQASRRAQPSPRRRPTPKAAGSTAPPPSGQASAPGHPKGWLATGADAVLMPVSLALLAVLAPLGWVSRRQAAPVDDSQS